MSAMKKVWYDTQCDWAMEQGWRKLKWGEKRGEHWLKEVHGNRYGHNVIEVSGLRARWLLLREWWRLWITGDDHHKGMLWLKFYLWRRGLPWRYSRRFKKIVKLCQQGREAAEKRDNDAV